MYETIAILAIVGAAIGVLVQFVGSYFWPTGKERPTDYLLYALIGAFGGSFLYISIVVFSQPHITNYHTSHLVGLITDESTFYILSALLSFILVYGARSEKSNGSLSLYCFSVFIPAIMILLLFGVAKDSTLYVFFAGGLGGAYAGVLKELRRQAGQIRWWKVILYSVVGAAALPTAWAAYSTYLAPVTY